jgi:hypothetical protein
MLATKSRFRPAALAFAAIILFLPACDSRQTQEIKLQRQWNAKVRETADLLAGVTDVPSAKAAEPKLKQMLQELTAIGKQMDKTADPESEGGGESAKLTQAVAEGIAEAQRLNAETLRISKNPEMVTALGESWKKLPIAMIQEAAGAIQKSQQKPGGPRP